MKRFFCTAIFIMSMSANGSTLPSGLNQNERLQLTEMIGSGISLRSAQLHRSLSAAEGLDLSLSFENLPLSQLQVMGNAQERIDDQSYFRLQIGKGLYRAVDVAFFLTPLNPNTPLSNFGGRLRWTFYQAPESPYFMAVYLDGNNGNLSDQLLIQSLSSGLQFGLKRHQLSLSFFVGGLKTFSRFRGGGDGVTDSGGQESQELFSYPVGLGGIYDFRQWYLGFAIDRQRESYFSAKLGRVF